MDNQNQTQIYLSVLKTAIQKSLNKNLPQILSDAVQYLEDHNVEVKQRKKRTRVKKPLQNIDDLQKKTQSISAQKMSTTAFFNLNTNRVNSDSQKIKDKHPNLKFGNLKQDGKTVWVCGTPGHLEKTLDTLKQNDEKSNPIFEPFIPQMEPILENPVEPEDLEDEDLEDEDLEDEEEFECIDCERRFGTEDECENHKCEKPCEKPRVEPESNIENPRKSHRQYTEVGIKPKKLKRRKKKPSTLILNARPPQNNFDFDSIYDISIYD